MAKCYKKDALPRGLVQLRYVGSLNLRREYTTLWSVNTSKLDELRKDRKSLTRGWESQNEAATLKWNIELTKEVDGGW